MYCDCIFLLYYLLFKLGGVPSCAGSLSKHPHYPNILIKTKTNMPATTKRQKTAHATHFPKDVLAHILSYCEDPMILYKRQHAKVWRAIGMRFAVNTKFSGTGTKIYATVNGKKKVGFIWEDASLKFPLLCLSTRTITAVQNQMKSVLLLYTVLLIRIKQSKNAVISYSYTT